MKLSQSFWFTLRETPSDATIASHQLMLRAGLMDKMTSGLYSMLPMGQRVIQKFTQIVREEHDRVGSQELQMSVVTPAELWRRSGRWEVYGSELLRATDANGQDVCITPTNEETVTDIFAKHVHSYKNLPQILYQIHTKFRDEIRPRFGLMRAREFTMKDAYSFHRDLDCLDRGYQTMYEVYSKIFERSGLEFTVVEADGGMIAGGKAKTHEFQVLAESGEDLVVYEPTSRSGANIEKAVTKPTDIKSDYLEQPQVKVHTPGAATIDEVAQYLKKEASQCLKTLIYSYEDSQEEQKKFVMCLLLGNDQLNEVKLKNALGVAEITSASSSWFAEHEMPVGFLGPIGAKGIHQLYIDECIDEKAYYIVGANEKDYHLQGFQLGRDFSQDYERKDLRLARSGDILSSNEKEVKILRGIEVGHIFQLGDKYTEAMGAKVIDQNGREIHPLMGTYGIGIGRTVAAAIEQNHDENGIVWPVSLAPYQVYFAKIGKSQEIGDLCLEIYQELWAAGIEVLYDDRNLRPGIMFKDADLLGLPLRVTLGERDYQEKKELEIKVRKTGAVHHVTRENLKSTLQQLLKELA